MTDNEVDKFFGWVVALPDERLNRLLKDESEADILAADYEKERGKAEQMESAT